MFLTVAFAGAAGGGFYYYYGPEKEGEDNAKPRTETKTNTNTNTKVLTPAPAIADDQQGDATVLTSDLSDLEQKTPQLYRDLLILNQLPLSGKGIYDIVTNPANGIRSHVYIDETDDAPDGRYSAGLVKVPRGEKSSTAFHEYFHAAQDVNDGSTDMFDLTMTDAAVCNLLLEASAVAYELVTQKEAENRGLGLFVPAPVVEQVAPGMTITHTTHGAADNKETIAVFNAAYDAVWEENESLDAVTREAKSLEAGGQAVVLFLLEGGDPDWASSYSEQAADNVNRNDHAFRNDGRERRTGYKDTRYAAYSKQGLVSPSINLIPEEYLGAEADVYIGECMKAMGLSVSDDTPAPKKTAQRFSAPGPGYRL